jgi:hypothetical protein
MFMGKFLLEEIALIRGGQSCGWLTRFWGGWCILSKFRFCAREKIARSPDLSHPHGVDR